MRKYKIRLTLEVHTDVFHTRLDEVRENDIIRLTITVSYHKHEAVKSRATIWYRYVHRKSTCTCVNRWGEHPYIIKMTHIVQIVHHQKSS